MKFMERHAPQGIIFPKGSWDLVSISGCHSNSLFCSSQQGLYQVLKQPLRTMFPHITGIYPSCLPPGNAWLQKHCMSRAQRHHTKCKKHKHFSLLKGWVASDLPECSRPPPPFSTELSVLNTEIRDWDHVHMILVHVFRSSINFKTRKH